ncbi:hypothetical protein C0Q70_08482 [Pomacea canaliculata]|uniref:DUF155 domain-containing protein n=1 Tax=Pomacea canaliculata TaxID=400727 RepID=A0A2T7PHZ7_POMCA|nr:hypothetical protein C0Q70_08482 [Pomacea canaliculata]
MSRCASQRILTRCNTTVAGIQKQVSALATKRPARKKTIKSLDEKKDIVDSVVAYAVAEEIDLNQLRKGLQVQGLYDISDLPVEQQRLKERDSELSSKEWGKSKEGGREDGSAVFWFMPEVERREVLKFLQKYATEPYSQSLVIHEREEMALTSIKGPTSLVNETLQLNEESDEGHATLEKYAFSNAIAQSVKLGIWEASLNKFVDSIEVVTEDLRDGRKISMSRREVLRKTGELFALRWSLRSSTILNATLKAKHLHDSASTSSPEGTEKGHQNCYVGVSSVALLKGS